MLKSLDEYELTAASLHDVYKTLGAKFNKVQSHDKSDELLEWPRTSSVNRLARNDHSTNQTQCHTAKKSCRNAECLSGVDVCARSNDLPLFRGQVAEQCARQLKLDCKTVRSRYLAEGRSFLTKTLPKLGKGFDKALAGHEPLNGSNYGFKTIKGTNLPRFLGELFKRVLDSSGCVLPEPSTTCVALIRQILYSFYKYEIPYQVEQEQQVLQKFERTEEELTSVSSYLDELKCKLDGYPATNRRIRFNGSLLDLVREARIALASLFASFDPFDIIPRHGPGAVATKQRLWSKFLWTNVSRNITSMYPLDAYFYASLGHVCDSPSFRNLGEEDLPARVILVPKDSRGPRLISCEPVDYQWIQQGLGTAIVSLVERHHLTRDNVRFTDQQPNQAGALLGSMTGEYATLDLNEASDRVSVSLVRLLFPSHITECLMACRSSSTELPDKRVLKLKKFAPMGSSLCFPILALTTWAILYAGAPDVDTRKSIYVYGDDVIVPTAYAEDAMKHLESFGLKINRDKSCTSGFFRESCGADAFKGKVVTPVRLRTVWSSSQLPNVYTSWIAYANSFYDRGFHETYNYIVSCLESVYGPIPGEDLNLSCPSLRGATVQRGKIHERVNKRFQRREFYVRSVLSPVVHHSMDGWSMLLRYFTEGAHSSRSTADPVLQGDIPYRPFRVRAYTRRDTSKLVKVWEPCHFDVSRSGLGSVGEHALCHHQLLEDPYTFEI